MSYGQDGDGSEFGSASLLDLFRMEAEGQAQLLNDGLLALERHGGDKESIDPLMRAAHSLKGAARIVGLDAVERLAHVMEECFVAAQKQRLILNRARIDRLLGAVDVIAELARLDAGGAHDWLQENDGRIADLLIGLYEAADPDNPLVAANAPNLPAAAPASHGAQDTQHRPQPRATPPAPAGALPSTVGTTSPTQDEAHPAAPSAQGQCEEHVLRVDARRLDRLLALAGEARVASHALEPMLDALQRLRKKQHEAVALLDRMRVDAASAELRSELDALRQRLAPLEQMLAERLTEFDAYESRAHALSRRLLDEVLDLRMRPFRDALLAYPRMVRDLAHSLGKEARLEIEGGEVPVDRDLLVRIDAPLTQVLRNAVDHGLEDPQQRQAAGKPREGVVRITARHAGGMLAVRIEDDGRGVDPEQIRRVVITRGMSKPAMAAAMSTAELFEFLLLPGFSLREQATQISGRGVGLDVLADTVRCAGGALRLESEAGKGFAVVLSLPLAQSLLRAVVVHSASEALALPLAHTVRVLRLPRSAVHMVSDRAFFEMDNVPVDLVPLAPLLELGPAPPAGDTLDVIVIGQAGQRFGLVVDAIVGERSLAVQPLTGALGKVRDVAGAAVLDDGEPVLVLDHADLLQGILKLVGEGRLHALPGTSSALSAAHAKRVLVVDDSLTVREMQRKLLVARGYQVEVAVDGMDGWNAVRGGSFELVITDVDMPRMDGIELVSLIKKDERLRNLPVMIVSYKDRQEDRRRGIEAGADYYLAKGSFHDETLLEAVADLIGESGA